MKLLISVLSAIFIFASTARADRPFEVELPIICNVNKQVVDELTLEYNERILIVNEDVNENGEPLIHTLWINFETKTWTFVITNDAHGISCIVASGEKLIIGSIPSGIQS